MSAPRSAPEGSTTIRGIESKPLVRVDNPVGEWNTFRIIMIGEKVTVYLNGTKVVDNVTMENYWDRKQPIFPNGPIELQAHGTDLAFRDLYVREITEKEYSLTEEERANGFASLFNGRNLDGWIGNKDGYKVEDGMMVYQPGAGNRRQSLYREGIQRFSVPVRVPVDSGRKQRRGNPCAARRGCCICGHGNPDPRRLGPDIRRAAAVSISRVGLWGDTG